MHEAGTDSEVEIYTTKLANEISPVSGTSCFSSNYLESGRWTKSENPVIPCLYSGVTQFEYWRWDTVPIRSRPLPSKSFQPVFHQSSDLSTLGNLRYWDLSLNETNEKKLIKSQTMNFHTIRMASKAFDWKQKNKFSLTSDNGVTTSLLIWNRSPLQFTGIGRAWIKNEGCPEL
jgi:hypothetical protein